MNAGRIIKFYREKANLTQEQLGKGICSATHVSKIERGLTEYASEITSLLVARLKIDKEKENMHLSSIKEKLDFWHEMIISQNMDAAFKVKEELKNNPLIHISDYENLYKLIQIKYHIKLNHVDEVQVLIKRLPKKIESMTLYEQNLHKHVLGIYYTMMSDHLKSVEILKSIDFEVYANSLAYYDLAIAYYYNKSPVLAYYYAEKALILFKEKNNFLGIIDTENLMLIQLESDHHRDFKETVEQYDNLIKICNLVNADDKKAKVLHNYAYEHLRRENYLKAEKLYLASMELKDKNTDYYLLSLEGYIRCGFEGELLSREKLLGHIHDGLEIAKNINETLFATILNLHKYAILEREAQYFRYIESKALPYFKMHGYIMLTQRYKKELFSYYTQNGEPEKALTLAVSLTDSIGD